MSNNSPKLVIVIHTEEEFAWGQGFYRSNTSVNHGQALIETVEMMLSYGAKVVFAMDYAFVNSEQGQLVIKHFSANISDNIEFAAHLHPWVNPPYYDNNDLTEDIYSYPGNLPEQHEEEKLTTLTETIRHATGINPTTYLAGRFGISEHSYHILNKLGYTVDLSISSFVDMRPQLGPDFSHYNNRIFNKHGLTHFPHTAGIVSIFPFLTHYLNKNPHIFTRLNNHRMSSIIAKLLRIQRLRLTPEGFSLAQMKQLTETQLSFGQDSFILSFHSPTVVPGNTSYVQTELDHQQFNDTIVNYLEWFKKDLNGNFFLTHQM